GPDRAADRRISILVSYWLSYWSSVRSGDTSGEKALGFCVTQTQYLSSYSVNCATVGGYCLVLMRRKSAVGAGLFWGQSIAATRDNYFGTPTLLLFLNLTTDNIKDSLFHLSKLYL